MLIHTTWTYAKKPLAFFRVIIGYGHVCHICQEHFQANLANLQHKHHVNTAWLSPFILLNHILNTIQPHHCQMLPYLSREWRMYKTSKVPARRPFWDVRWQYFLKKKNKIVFLKKYLNHWKMSRCYKPALKRWSRQATTRQDALKLSARYLWSDNCWTSLKHYTLHIKETVTCSNPFKFSTCQETVQQEIIKLSAQCGNLIPSVKFPCRINKRRDFSIFTPIPYSETQ